MDFEVIMMLLEAAPPNNLCLTIPKIDSETQKKLEERGLRIEHDNHFQTTSIIGHPNTK